MEFLKRTRSVPAQFRHTGARAIARAVTCALEADGGRSVGVRLDRTVKSTHDVAKPIDDSYILFDSEPAAVSSARRGSGNSASRVLLRVVLVPAPGAGCEAGAAVALVVQPVGEWEWISSGQLEDPSLWVLSAEATAAAHHTPHDQSPPLAVTTLDIVSPPYAILAGDLSGPEQEICDAFEHLRHHIRQSILARFPACLSASASQAGPDLNCEPDCAETVLVRRPPFPSDADIHDAL